MGKKELIWVDEDFAKKFTAMTEKKCKEDLQSKALEDYLQTVCQSTRDEYKGSLDALEEDLAIYKGLMLKTKQSFEKAKDESLSASYEMWEKYDKELSAVRKKVGLFVEELEPIKQKTSEIEGILKKINDWPFKNFLEVLSKISILSKENKDIISFLFKNYTIK